MPLGYMYKVFDIEKNRELPGVFQSKEVREMIGITGNIAEQSKAGTIFKGRYKVTIVGEWSSSEDNWAEEWDKARLKLLRGK